MRSMTLAGSPEFILSHYKPELFASDIKRKRNKRIKSRIPKIPNSLKKILKNKKNTYIHSYMAHLQSSMRLFNNVVYPSKRNSLLLIKYRKIPKISPGAYIFQRPF